MRSWSWALSPAGACWRSPGSRARFTAPREGRGRRPDRSSGRTCRPASSWRQSRGRSSGSSPDQTGIRLAVGTPWVRVVGLAILIGSTAFALWARVALDTMWSSSPTVKVQHQLRTDGPYGVTRHPIYTGLLGMMLGTVLLVGFGHWLVLLPVSVVFLEIRIHIEEGLMLATFPEAYPRYRRRVPQLVPGLRRLHRSRTDT
jgi:protein-S-isoprenylcysteine O-methyltransferase Ste14